MLQIASRGGLWNLVPFIIIWDALVCKIRSAWRYLSTYSQLNCLFRVPDKHFISYHSSVNWDETPKHFFLKKKLDCSSYTWRFKKWSFISHFSFKCSNSAAFQIFAWSPWPPLQSRALSFSFLRTGGGDTNYSKTWSQSEFSQKTMVSWQKKKSYWIHSGKCCAPFCLKLAGV